MHNQNFDCLLTTQLWKRGREFVKLNRKYKICFAPLPTQTLALRALSYALNCYALNYALNFLLIIRIVYVPSQIFTSKLSMWGFTSCFLGRWFLILYSNQNPLPLEQWNDPQKRFFIALGGKVPTNSENRQNLPKNRYMTWWCLMNEEKRGPRSHLLLHCMH